MSNVIKFPDQADFKSISYIDDDGDLGVAMRDRSLQIYRLNDKEFELVLNKTSVVFKREELAEFLWVTSYFLDSEKIYLPKLELVCCDYK